MGDIYLYKNGLEEIFICVYGSLLYLTDTFPPSLLLVMKLPLSTRLMIFKIPQDQEKTHRKPQNICIKLPLLHNRTCVKSA